MKETKIKKKKKLRIINIVSVVFVLYFIYTLWDQQLQLNKYNSQIQMYNSDINSKSQLVEYYNNQKTSITSNEYIEKVARETLGYVKPYEKIFIDANR